MRTWELASTAISSATDSDTAHGEISHFLGSMYIITSGAVLMTIQVHESVDNSNWAIVDEQIISGNYCYRVAHPFIYLKIVVSDYTSGQIDSIVLLGAIR
jgi:hypothetical protein